MADVELQALIEFANANEQFNDIWLYGTDDKRDPLESEPVVTLIGKHVPGLLSFGSHGDGSLFAMWEDRICWLDSEGEQFVIARDFDHFTDLLMFYLRDVRQAAEACQETDNFVENFRGGKHRTLEELVSEFAWLKTSPEELRKKAWFVDGANEFTAWAADRHRAAPADLIARLVELRATTTELRRLCS